METTITEKAEMVCKYFGWSHITKESRIVTDNKRNAAGWYFRINTTNWENWIYEKDIEAMYDLIKTKEIVNLEAESETIDKQICLAVYNRDDEEIKSLKERLLEINKRLFELTGN